MIFTQPLKSAMKYHPPTDSQDPEKDKVNFFLEKVVYSYIMSN